MGFFEAFREKPSATRYGEMHSSASFDLFDATLVYVFCAIGFAFVILLPGYFHKERIAVAIRIFVSLFIGASILACNFGMQWKESSVSTVTQYKAFMSQEIQAKIGVNIGLRGINVTLKGLPLDQTFDNNKTVEHVDYNEKFRWNSPWSQGRMGFGSHASQINNEYHMALQKGIPYPILLIAEYFTLDGESVRWGRCYRLAGFYTQALLWLGFALWLITNILFLNVIRYGSYFLSFTGVVILLSNLIYHSIHFGPELTIPFAYGVLSFTYGWCFWLSLATGFLCVTFGTLITVLDYFHPGPVSTFFNIDIVTEFEDVVVAEDELPSGSESRDGLTSFGSGLGEETGECKNKTHFLYRSRYAGISSNWRLKKLPLDMAKSFPLQKPKSLTRSLSSVKININQPHDNKAFRASDSIIGGNGSKEFSNFAMGMVTSEGEFSGEKFKSEGKPFTQVEKTNSSSSDA